MQYTKDEEALIWLTLCSGLDFRESERMLSLVPSPHMLFEQFEELVPRAVPQERRAVLQKSNLAQRNTELSNALSRMEKKNYFAVTRVTEDYPEQLAAIDTPPLVLFGAGNRALLKEKIFCIVGSRRTPPQAMKYGEKFAEELSDYFAIVTGLAEGGDLSALQGALKKKRAICVLPCGLNECYPAAHSDFKEKVKKDGLLLSESLDDKTRQYSFYARNRILAGISLGTLILSAGERSGTLITANACLNYGRELFAIPYDLSVPQGRGCNLLIQQGAYLCLGSENILNNFGIFMKEKPTLPELTKEEKEILTTLADGEELHASVIAQRAKIEIFEAFAILAKLEMKQVVVKTGGNCYKIIG